MSGVEQDVRLAVSILLTLPILAVWTFALIDIVRRRDLPVMRKLVYGAIVVLIFPATLLYLLARPTSIVRHRERAPEDWRDELVDHLEVRPGAPPVLSRRQEQVIRDRVEALGSGRALGQRSTT